MHGPRRPLVAGNWKMNGTRADSPHRVQRILERARADQRAEICVCPPYVLIPLVADLLGEDRRCCLGAQNLSRERGGAFTGEVFGVMLSEQGCRYVIVGHSERRALFGESDETVAAKVAAAQASNLIPILCVGETLEQREAGMTESVVEAQLAAVLNGTGLSTAAVVAYEPVWAIGTGRTATPQQAQAVHAFVRARLAAHDPELATAVRVLYGGSVRAANAAALFAQPDIDGGLVGGASLDADEFMDICAAA